MVKTSNSGLYSFQNIQSIILAWHWHGGSRKCYVYVLLLEVHVQLFCYIIKLPNMKSDYKGFVRKDVQKFIDNGGVGPLFDGIHNWGSLQVLTIDSPLKPLLIQNLLSELNSFIFLEKASDLFQFQQSLDFRQLEKDSKPMCVKLHKIFEKHLKKLAGSLFNIDLSGEVSMTASKYCYKDFLMCHDDQVEDRGVAFILYLEDWQKENGGTLDFFHHDERGLADDVTFSILPIANRLVLFSVNDLSHHQVAEVLCKDKPRLAISGWFHTGKTINRSIKLLTDRAPIFSPVLMDHPVTEIAFEMDYLYLQNDVSYFAVNAQALRAEIVNNRCVLLKPFLNEKCYNSVLDELQSSKVKWHNVGSAARRKYEVAEMNRRRVNNCPAISELLFKLQGTSFLKILSLFIMKKLDDADEARISIATEVIRFKKGNYMLVVDDKMYNKQSSVDLWVFFNADHIDSTTGGDFGYFNQKKKRTLSLTPSSNGAFIVARMPNLLPFMAYMNNDTGDNIHYAISVKYSVSYKLSELRGPLTQLSAIIYGNENKMTVVNEINEQARMKKKATDHQVDTHQKRRFGMLESGCVSIKNEVNIMMKNIVDIFLGGFTYWLFGYGLSFGYDSNLGNQFVGTGQFALDVEPGDPYMGPIFTAFLFQLSFATTATTIVSGAMAERCNFKAYCLFSFFNTIVYCIPAGWVWGDHGFLRSLGMVDIAGSGPVHLVGGVSAFASASMLGPRLGRYMHGTNPLPLGTPVNCCMGLFVLWWGWLAFNSGSTYGVSGAKWQYAAKAAVMTMLSSFGGGFSALVYTLIVNKGFPNIMDLINGVLGSLVAVTAGCFLYQSWISIFIGCIGGLLACVTMPMIDKMGIDDPVGATSVHGIAGFWGVLAVGLFADNPQPMNTTSGRKGLVNGGDWYLLGVQALGCLCLISWSLITTVSLLWIINKVISIRMEPHDELLGADFAEHRVLHAGVGVSRAISGLDQIGHRMRTNSIQAIGSNPGHENFLEKYIEKRLRRFNVRDMDVRGKEIDDQIKNMKANKNFHDTISYIDMDSQFKNSRKKLTKNVKPAKLAWLN